MNTKIIKTNSMNEMETTENAAMIWDYTYDQDFKVGFTNEKGDLIIPHKYNECLYINKGIALVTVNGKCRITQKLKLYVSMTQSTQILPHRLAINLDL